VVDTYLSTVLAEYLEGIKKETGNIPVEFMQSNGTLSHPVSFLGKNALFSGPAGGAVAVAAIAEEKELKGIIGFDMGGTSTDVSRYDGTFAKRYEQKIGGIPLQLEMLDIITVAAGGGSILCFDGQKMTVGPDSAGSSPGPACYGFGGPLTITDANLITGKIVPEYFPNTFGPDRHSPVNSESARQKFLVLADEINRAMGTSLTPQGIAAGFLRIANEKMAMAIKEISVSRGLDIRRYGLVCFGGAGGQHACALARLLDINRIVIHPLSGVLSAYLFDIMEKQLSEKTERGDRRYEIRRELDLRPSGADTFITLEYMGFDVTLTHFLEQYRKIFGFSLENTPLEVANIRMNIHESAEFFIPFAGGRRTSGLSPEPLLFQDIYYPEGQLSAPVYQRESLPCNRRIPGPALIIDQNSTIVVDPDFTAELDSSGTILITALKKQLSSVSASKDAPDPVLLEVFNNIFMGVATEMGVTLKNTAYSVNIKERLDFSCAVFDAEGHLVANAPHIPVHLGAMADTVKALIEVKGNTMKGGDIYLTNNPYQGGSHLPDMTVICPVYSEAHELIFFTASRGHHSDVGGKTPGSMPPTSQHIEEEGVLIDNFLLVRDGVFREKDLREILSNHRYPVRNIPERLYDFRAQIAACNKGKMDLLRFIKRYGLNMVQEYMHFIQENSEYSVKRALQRFLQSDNVFSSSFEDLLDDGTPLKVRISIDGGPAPPATLTAIVDFSGTGLQHRSDNLNAPLSVVRSAVLYVLRTLIERDIPLNSGCLKPINIIVPEGTVLNPLYPSPVASGNVETSQRIVDVLLGAFGIAGASQGTMNNLLFEVEGEPPYYETIAGGAGAIDGCPGASAVQVHMTNTRITDPEILEFRHPGVRLEQFTVRTGSGGRGKL
jgi:5-oxoprolinase (ATP-hydrolysing)